MHGMKRRTVLVLAFCAAVLAAAGCTCPRARIRAALRARLATSRVIVLDNFDSEVLWKAELDQGDPAKLETVRPEAGKPNGAMGVTFELGKKKKVVIGCEAYRLRDLSKYNLVVMDVDSKLAATCRLSLAVLTLPGWKYFESRVLAIRPGVNKDVMFRLDLPNFKCEESKWLHNRAVANLSDTRKLVLIIHPAGGGSIQIDNLRLAAFEPPAEPKTKTTELKAKE